MEALPKAYKSLLTMACGYANLDVKARYDARNPQALERLVANGALLHRFSQGIMEACLKASNEVNAETSAANPDFKKIYDSQRLAGTTEISGGRSRNIATKTS